QGRLADAQTRLWIDLLDAHFVTELVEGRRHLAVVRPRPVHRQYDGWLKLADDFRGLRRRDTGSPADGNAQHIDRSYLLQLIRGEDMAQFTQVTDAQFLQLNDIYSVAAALLAGLSISIGAHTSDEDPFDLVFAGPAHGARRSVDHGDALLAALSATQGHDVGRG